MGHAQFPMAGDEPTLTATTWGILVIVDIMSSQGIKRLMYNIYNEEQIRRDECSFFAMLSLDWILRKNEGRKLPLL